MARCDLYHLPPYCIPFFKPPMSILPWKKISQDAVRLLCSAERQKHAPDFSIDKLQAELRSFRDNEAPKRVVRKVPNKDPVCWDPGPIHGRTSWRLKNGGGFVKSKQFVPRFPVFLPGQTWPGLYAVGSCGSSIG